MSGLSFNEVMQYAGSNYYNGGDVISEHWDERTYNDYVKQFGPVTKRKLDKLFQQHKQELAECKGRME